METLMPSAPSSGSPTAPRMVTGGPSASIGGSPTRPRSCASNAVAGSAVAEDRSTEPFLLTLTLILLSVVPGAARVALEQRPDERQLLVGVVALVDRQGAAGLRGTVQDARPGVVLLDQQHVVEAELGHPVQPVGGLLGVAAQVERVVLAERGGRRGEVDH